MMEGIYINLPSFGCQVQIPGNSLPQNCRSVKEFENSRCLRIGKLEEFYNCFDVANLKPVTLVKYKAFTSPNKELKVLVREIGIIKKLKHPNILQYIEPAIYRITSMHLIFEPFPCFLSDIIYYQVEKLKQPSVIKSVMFQLLSGLDYIHEHAVMHRNIHPNNLAIDQNGCLKICNFRNSRHLWDNDVTLEIEDFRYQSAEALMELSLCSAPVDIWSAACIFCELLLEKRFFNGSNISSVLGEIFAIFGFPTKMSWPRLFELPEYTCIYVEDYTLHSFNYLEIFFKRCKRPQDSDTMNLLQSMFCLDPKERSKASSCLNYSYFKKEPKACKQDELKHCINIALNSGKTSK